MSGLAEKKLYFPNEIAANILGMHDENLKEIEESFPIKIVVRGTEILLQGEKSIIDQVEVIFLNLGKLALTGQQITKQEVRYAIQVLQKDITADLEEIYKDVIQINSRGKQIKPKTLGQKQYIEYIKNNDIVFAIGPAGTGKTYLAIVMAVTALQKKEVSRIILTRPAVEAGEKLGFLPGDLQEKVDPYLRPIYDALGDILGIEKFQRFMERGTIEVAPLAYMRGRTLDDSFIVLDEAQNTTSEQMKMFLTRMGFGSKMVITGDITQIDLPKGRMSGLIEAQNILKGVKGIGFAYLTSQDIVRHPLVQRIIDAYDLYDKHKEETE